VSTRANKKMMSMKFSVRVRHYIKATSRHCVPSFMRLFHMIKPLARQSAIKQIEWRGYQGAIWKKEELNGVLGLSKVHSHPSTFPVHHFMNKRFQYRIPNDYFFFHTAWSFTNQDLKSEHEGRYPFSISKELTILRESKCTSQRTRYQSSNGCSSVPTVQHDVRLDAALCFSLRHENEQ
jgi:hypothetical protein